MFFTYLHRRQDTGEVFYVGKGRAKRPHDRGGRSVHWRRVAAKHGRAVEVLAPWPTDAEAKEHEKFLIQVFRDLGAPLVNVTEGGDGASGVRPSEVTRAKQRAAKVGRSLSPGHRKRISESGRGHSVSAETRLKISQRHAGRPSPLRGIVRAPEVIAATVAGRARTLGADGRSMLQREWARELGVCDSTISARVRRGCFPCGRARA